MTLVMDSKAAKAYVAVCQGHGGCRDHGCGDEYCEGHGAVSYCGEMCDSAREMWVRWLERHWSHWPEPSGDHVALEAHGGGVSYRVRFDGPDAEARALAYVEARNMVLYFGELPEDPLSFEAFPNLYEVLHPKCVHTLPADSCEGPDHYMTRDQEMAMGW